MQAFATHKNARVSPRKVRVYRQVIKGLPVRMAEAQLRLMPGKIPQLLRAVLKSAIANAVNAQSLDVGQLVISDVVVDGGFVFTRYQPMSRGSAYPITKRTAHITIIVKRT